MTQDPSNRLQYLSSESCVSSSVGRDSGGPAGAFGDLGFGFNVVDVRRRVPREETKPVHGPGNLKVESENVAISVSQVNIVVKEEPFEVSPEETEKAAQPKVVPDQMSKGTAPFRLGALRVGGRQKGVEGDKKAARQREARANMSFERRQAVHDRDATRKRQARANASPERCQAERCKDATRKRQARANMSPERRQAERAKHAAQQRRARANMSPERRQAERDKHAAQQRQARANMSPERRQAKRDRHAAQQRQARANMTLEYYSNIFRWI